MLLIVLGVIVFFSIHALPWHPNFRAGVVVKLGPSRYRASFSVVALVGLVLLIIGKVQAPFISLYTPPIWGRTLALPLVFVALILLPAANMPPSNIKRLIRHPMLVGILLWSCAHLLANGDVASVILFGSFAIYSAVDILSANSRGKNKHLLVAPISKDIMVIAAGSVAYVIILFAHPYLFGAPVIL